MDLNRAFEESEALAEELLSLIDVPLLNDSQRIDVADVACSLALEHWHSVRLLLQAGLLPSALVTHRAQFEAIVRSIWLTYCATDTDISKLAARLDLESEQAAKNISGSSRIVVELSEADQDPLLKIDKIPKSVTHAFHCLDRIVNTFNDARGHPMREVV